MHAVARLWIYRGWRIDANEPVQRMQERVADLPLIDYMMLETDGMTTLQRCHAEPGGKQVRALMLTSDSRLVTLELALTLGFNEFLPKPNSVSGKICAEN
jgi:CheY-like chemotaxis protein